MKKKRKGYYSISVVAKMFSVHQQTIRLYEKEGLISPKRSSGNTRLFSEDDVDRLEEIIYLTHKLGVNLAGVEVILNLQKKVNKLQKEINRLFEHTQENLKQEEEAYKESAKKHAKRLINIKQSKTEQSQSEQLQTEQAQSGAVDKAGKTGDAKGKPVDVEIVDDWQVEYDD